MAETIVSPGVLAIENDQSFTTQQPVQAGAAIIGPTVKGKVGIPTLVTTYSDYVNKFGTSFLSGSQYYTYLTSITAYNYFAGGGNTLLVTRVVSGSTATAWTPASSSFISASSHAAGAPYNTSPFILETISEGILMNSVGPTGSNGTLLSGSNENYRWQITSPNTSSGTFYLIIRQGNDSNVQQSILETWGPLSLDPFASNYVEKVIGNQVENVASDNGEYYIQLSGSYANKSAYVRISQVNQSTPEYLDNIGNPKPQFTGSIPKAQTGVFGDGKGRNVPTGIAGAYYNNITNTNIQGLSAGAYTESISLLANKDAFKYNLLVAPGLIADPTNYPAHYTVVNQIIDTVQSRGDSMTVIDLVGYNSNLLPVVANAQAFDTSYAAAYWPWVYTIDPSTANQVWVPATAMIPRVYAQNDAIAYPWYAPAGINRGIMTNVIKVERVLTQGNRDTLYQANINPIATLQAQTGASVTVFGQKTLQKKASALDRVNVRRLLIELKNYISQVADTFVFEQNTEATRNSFLSLINPYLSLVQQQQGLTSFQVIINETNNTPTVIDQNQLVGQIYLQPTRTVEFIVLDFNILPTGATFPA
jgi:phage tail sheath protein FI